MATPDAPRPPLSAGRSALDRRTLWTLLTGHALTGIGIGFFLPILPLFVRSRGGDPFLVGIIFASGVLGRTVAQYPAGWLSDRYGRKPLILGSLLVYSLLFPLYLLPMPPEVLIGLRFVHTIAGGAYTPPAMALVADLTPPSSRGRRYSQMRASDMVGLLLGPALGGFVAGFRLEYVFAAGGVICLAATLLLLRLPAVAIATWPGPERDAGGVDHGQAGPLGLLRLLLPVIALSAPAAWTFGTYDTVWSLYMTSRGASTFLVGLSFATYALPVVLFAGLGAGLADRLGHFRAGALSLVTFGLLASLYPFIASVPLLITIGFLEGTLTAAGIPALQAEVSRLAPRGAQARTQGVFQIAFNVAEIVGSVAGGALYGLRPAYAFFGATSVCLLGVGASLLIRRAPSA